MQKKIEIQKVLLLRLEFTIFLKYFGPPEKFYKAKNIFLENKSCSTNMGKQLCQKTKNSYLLTFRDNGGHKKRSKIHLFRNFWPLDGVGEVWKPQKWICFAQKPLF